MRAHALVGTCLVTSVNSVIARSGRPACSATCPSTWRPSVKLGNRWVMRVSRLMASPNRPACEYRSASARATGIDRAAGGTPSSSLIASGILPSAFSSALRMRRTWGIVGACPFCLREQLRGLFALPLAKQYACEARLGRRQPGVRPQRGPVRRLGLVNLTGLRQGIAIRLMHLGNGARTGLGALEQRDGFFGVALPDPGCPDKVVDEGAVRPSGELPRPALPPCSSLPLRGRPARAGAGSGSPPPPVPPLGSAPWPHRGTIPWRSTRGRGRGGRARRSDPAAGHS